MFDTLIALSRHALNRREDFDTFDEYVAHTASRRKSTYTNNENANSATATANAITNSTLWKRLKRIQIGTLSSKLGYVGVGQTNEDDDRRRPRREPLGMLPRVCAGGSPNDHNWQPVGTDETDMCRRPDEHTVLDRFVRIVQVDRREPLMLDERRMARFYVMHETLGWVEELFVNSYEYEYEYSYEYGFQDDTIFEDSFVFVQSSETQRSQGDPQTASYGIRL